MSADRCTELLIDRAIWGLDAAEEAELARAIESGESEFDLGWERAVAVATLVLEDEPAAIVPPELVERLERDAANYFSFEFGSQRKLRAVPPAAVAPRTSNAWSRLGWFVAAAAIIVAAWLGWDRIGGDASPARARSEMLARGDAIRLDWSRGPSDRAGDPTGDVVWDAHAQAGFMRFRGLPANDPAEFQYQLWIFDGERGTSPPVDGGVFDIANATLDTVVPIDPKLLVGKAVTFAVTIERPGGVVVSEQEHIVTLAKP
ncbi:MAG: anti-sigma factor [Planctomycetes bacterium]|nr:anti-sigma factor [Planctomycetota bacterium]